MRPDLLELGGQVHLAQHVRGAGRGVSARGSVNFDKTKFTLPAGLALGAFHHFIYAPYKAGNLRGLVPARACSDVRSGVGLRPSKAG